MSAAGSLRILLVVESFPPHTSGGRSYRAAKLVKSLTRSGCRVLVLCGDRELDSDPGLLEGVDFDNLEVVRCPQPPESRWVVRLRQLLRQLFLMDGRLDLVFRLLSSLKESAPDFVPDVVITSSAPYEVHWVGYLLKRRLGCCWVSDWRDPFTLNRNYSKRLPTARLADGLAESFIYRRSDGVIFNTRCNLEQAAETFGLDASDPRYTVCQNGYDPSDLPADLRAPPAGEGQDFVLSYIGGVRGDPVERLFVSRVLEQRAALVDRGIRIRLVGNGSETFREEAERSQAALELVGFLPQAELGRIWRESSALLIFLPPSKDPLGWVPQKLYPYLASGHPILAFVPPGEARDYLSQAGGHVIRDPEDYDLLETIDSVVQASREDEPGTHDRESVERFDQSRLFAQLQRWLRERVEG
jgi:glycosyltransferase involved in cell wall biosynthesis